MHAADTVREAHRVCDPVAAELLAREAPDRVRELAGWGCGFDRTAGGHLAQRPFGAQSYRRTCFAGDRTGEEIMGALVGRAKALGVAYRESVFVTRILTQEGRAAGAVGYDLAQGAYVIFEARAVVLAAGGLTSLYRRGSSRRDENTGDAALAFEAGASLKDMEFVQFHPTGMVKPERVSGMLVTEAVRGEGGRLYNAEGERFMERYSPERMELDARDVVARAIYAEIQAGRGTPDGAVLLDISHREPAHIKERLPEMYARFGEQRVDIIREPMEVAPTAHHGMGGVAVDFRTGATGTEGLFAVGEATAGVHSANRLGGNSLAETVVFGRSTGSHLVRYLRDAPSRQPDPTSVGEHLLELEGLHGASGSRDPEALADELRRLLWDHAGITRTREGLQEGFARLERLHERRVGTGGDPARLPHALNLRFMLTTAEAVLRSALLREESRGAHHRDDFPETRGAWEKNVLCERTEGGRMRLRTSPVGAVPEVIRAELEVDRQLSYHHLE